MNPPGVSNCDGDERYDDVVVTIVVNITMNIVPITVTVTLSDKHGNGETRNRCF